MRSPLFVVCPTDVVDLNSWQSSTGIIRMSSLCAPTISQYAYRATTAKEINCGTIACAAGWLSLHPHFQNLGLSARRESGVPEHWKGQGYAAGYGALAAVFDMSYDSAKRLFQNVQSFEINYCLDFNMDVSDRQIWLWRALRLIDGQPLLCDPNLSSF